MHSRGTAPERCVANQIAVFQYLSTVKLNEIVLEDAMEIALEEARSALDHDDVPVGAAIFVDGRLVARRHNEREKLRDPTAHAELLAIRDASAKVGSWRLDNSLLVVTLEPCVMCAGASVAARLTRLAFGAFDPKAGAAGSLYNVCSDPRLNHDVPIMGGVRQAECAELLTSFFESKRRRENDPG